MERILKHLPTHAGKILTGRLANRGEKITCNACKRQITHAAELYPLYARELMRNLQPGYVEDVYIDASERNASLAKSMAHFFNIATYEGGAR